MRKCRICKRDIVAPTAGSQAKGNKYFPFCSERCQLVDLGKWLNEEYRIPGEPVSPDDIERGNKS